MLHAGTMGRYLRGALTALAYSPTLDRAAMCGGNQVKVLSLLGQEYAEIKEDALEFDVATQVCLTLARCSEGWVELLRRAGL
jgi:hypothetical protein